MQPEDRGCREEFLDETSWEFPDRGSHLRQQPYSIKSALDHERSKIRKSAVHRP
jgi:hypothetical protein